MNIAQTAQPGSSRGHGDPDSGVLQRFAELAARILKVPMAVFSLAAEPKPPEISASFGLSDETAPGVLRLVNRLAGPNDAAIVPESSADAPIYAAAAAAMYGQARVRLGTLAVFAPAPHLFSAGEREMLADIAALAAARRRDGRSHGK